jgi:hypothetical protein
MWTGFKAIVRGESHKEKDLPCQDAVSFTPYRNGGVIACADGHGSEKHFRSDAGAAFAVRIAEKAIYDFSQLQREAERARNPDAKRFAGEEMRREQIRQLERFIITRWRAVVLKHCAVHPLDDGERGLCEKLGLDGADENTIVRFYGTTLLAGIVKTEYWFIIQIGDGRCVVIDEKGKAGFPGIDDEALGFGKTTSLCDSDAAAKFREIYGFTPIRGITVATDGVTDSFIPEAYLEFHEKLYADFCRDAKMASAGIKKGIGVWAANGSRDDAAMAGVFKVGKKA